ncbi:MAG TPA: hypothetical protein VKP59_03270 [Candidatus Thermoplasmatota archaeon]|nr:hypothetical protein [Candidatus Thermoplasmatota archaeon]
MKKAYDKKTLIFLIMGIVLLVTGCVNPSSTSSSVNTKFVGTWISDPFLGLEITFAFNDDGTVNMQGDVNRTGIWSTQDDSLTMSFEDETEGYSFTGDYTFEFSNSDKTVTLVFNSVVLTLNKV